MDYREEMKQLRDFLNQQSYLYYVLDAPVIPDYEYDRLNRRLEELEAEHPEEITPDSPTQRVGDKILEGFETYEHPVPLESLQDVFNAEEVSEFLDRMREALGTAPPTRGAQGGRPVRGPGVSGRRVRPGRHPGRRPGGGGRDGEPQDHPRPSPCSCRRSCPGSSSGARSICPGRCSRRSTPAGSWRASPSWPIPGTPPPGPCGSWTPRSARSGSWISRCSTSSWRRARPSRTTRETLDYMASQHFKVIPHKTLSDPAEIQAEIDRINEERMDYPFDIDGAVIKVDHLADRERLGSTAKFPPSGRWPSSTRRRRSPVVQDIVVQVGRTGVLTPKAVLEPVRLAGTTVTNATLHNQDFITEKDIRIGDTGAGAEGGEIIPEILSVDLGQRPGGHGALHAAGRLPGVRRPGGPGRGRRPSAAPARSARPSCCATSPTSPAGTPWTSTAAVRRWCSSWWTPGWSPTPADLYSLHAADVAKLDRMGRSPRRT